MAEPTFNFFNYIDRINSERVVIDMTDDIFLDRPQVTPILAFTTLATDVRNTENMEFNWIEDTLRPYAIQLESGVTAPSPETDEWDFEVPNSYGAFFADANTVFFASNGTQFKVSSVEKGTDPAVDPDIVHAYKWPSTQGACGNLAQGSNLIMSYPVVGDLQDVVKGNFRDVVAKKAYNEQFMRSVSLNRTVAKTRLYGGDLRKHEHLKQMLAFKTDQEAAMIYGIGAKDETNKGDDSLGGTIWRMNGIRNSGLHGIDLGSAVLDYPTFLGLIPEITDLSDLADLVCLAPNDFLKLINEWAYDALHTSSGEKRFGFAVTALDTTSGPINFLRAKMLEKFANPEVFFLNTKTIRRTRFGGLDGMEGAPKLYMNAQLSTQPNKILDFYNGFGGLEFKNAHLSSKMYGWS
jgi:hypothetical protein